MDSKIVNISYEPIWGVLNILGFFDAIEEKNIIKIELFYGDVFISNADYGYRYFNKLMGYRLETYFKVDNFDKMKIRAKYFINDNLIKTDIFYSEKISKNPLNAISRLYRIVKYRYILNSIFKDRVGRKNIIVLFILSLDAQEIMQKLYCFEAINMSLKKYGWSLLIAHCSGNKINTDIDTIEINTIKVGFLKKIFFKKKLKQFRKDMELAVGFLYEFHKSLNNHAMYSVAYDKVLEQFIKSTDIIEKYKPYGVLCWHQWSSLSYMATTYAKSK